MLFISCCHHSHYLRSKVLFTCCCYYELATELVLRPSGCCDWVTWALAACSALAEGHHRLAQGTVFPSSWGQCRPRPHPEAQGHGRTRGPRTEAVRGPDQSRYVTFKVGVFENHLTLVCISGPGSSCGDITRDKRKSEKSREQTRMVNSLRQFLTQDSRTVRVRMVDLWHLPALSSSLFLMARTAWSGPWPLELTKSQMARLASQFSEIRCSSVASSSWKRSR